MRASMKWPMRAFAITGIFTSCMIFSMMPMLAIRATPPSLRISALGSAATTLAYIGRHTLQRHHRRCPRILRDLGLLGVGDVHDDAALEHLRQPDLHSKRLARKIKHCFSLVARAVQPAEPRVISAFLHSRPLFQQISTPNLAP